MYLTLTTGKKREAVKIWKYLMHDPEQLPIPEKELRKAKDIKQLLIIILHIYWIPITNITWKA